MTLKAGTRLGPYEVETPLGAGGMGEVYRARDTRLEREVAIKILPEHLADNPTWKARFEREAKTISRLSHPHICTLHDVGNEGNLEYLVLELVEGQTLAERLSHGALPIDQVVRYGIEIADALEAAHKHGVVHRDLKPGNVMLTKSGVKLLDFGLAKYQSALAPEEGEHPSIALTRTAPSGALTGEGTLVGTFQYMAPEQLEGKEADARSDIFALGCVLYEMATGRPAFGGASRASIIGAILKEEPEPLAALQPAAPPILERLVSTCLAKDPDDRFATAHDVKLELQWIAEGGSQAGASVVVSARRKGREKLAWAIAALAILSSLVLGTGFLLRAPKTPRVVRATIDLPPGLDLRADDPLAFSPDGKTLAIAAVDLNKSKAAGKDVVKIYLRALDGSALRALDGTDGAWGLTWSPDGRSLAFFAFDDKKLKKIDVATGVVQTLADLPVCRRRTWCPPQGITWGPDGTIVYAPKAHGPLQRISANGGSPEAIEKDPGEGFFHWFPSFLPDGKSLLYVSVPRDDSQKKDGGLFALDLESGKSRRILPDLTVGRYVPPGYLAFTRDHNLMVQRFDPGTLRLSGKAISLAQSIPEGGEPPFVGAFRTYAFAVGGLLVYQERALSKLSQLTWFDASFKELGTVGKPMEIFDPKLSPDARRAVVVVGALPKTRLSMVDLTTGVPSPLTLAVQHVRNPVWSPDGESVIYESLPSDGDLTSMESILVKKADGGSPAEKVASIGPIGETVLVPISWSPDGSVVGYTQKSPETKSWDVGILSMRGNHERTLLFHGPAYEAEPRFSPDGKWLAYISDESGSNQIYLVSYPALAGRRQITTNGSMGGFLWLSDHEIFNLSSADQLIGLKPGPNGALVVGWRRTVWAESHPVFGRGYDYSPTLKRWLLPMPVGRNFAAPRPITLVTHWTQLLKQD